MAFPVVAITKPAALVGQPNGQLPDHLLVDTPGQARGPTVRLVAPAARAWRALCAAALRAGHTLKASSLVDSYRPLSVQTAIFQQRFTTSRVSGTRRVWNGRSYYLKPGYALAAVPGTSNHGLALAVDTGEETDGDSGTESIDAGTLAWLVANERTYGWSHEVQSEPWHIRYVDGDAIPAAVLAYEAGTTPTTPTPTGALMALSDKEQARLVRRVDAIYEQLAAPGDRKTFVNVQTGNPRPEDAADATAVSDVWAWQRRTLEAVAALTSEVAEIKAAVAILATPVAPA